MVLQIVLWILLALVVLIFMVLLFPAALLVQYTQSELSVYLQVLFLRMKLFPPQPKRHKKQKKGEQKKQEKKQRKPMSFLEILHRTQKIASSAGAGIRFLARFLSIRNLSLVVPVHGEDASITAIRTGQMQAAVGTVRAVLENLISIHYKMLQIYPDFNGQSTSNLYFSCKIGTSPVIIIIAAVVAFKRYLTYARPDSRKKKKNIAGSE